MWAKKDLGRLTANQDVLILGPDPVGEKIKLPYVQHEDGCPVNNATAAEVYKHAYTIFASLLKMGVAAQTFGRLDVENLKYYNTEMKNRFEWLGWCDNP